ncbi:MAG: polyprenyl synthetase family protein [Deltaproteobacteria bacterium]|nr:polyprenyl synthetase family protein [Deltaproteobacteria bacterium]
MSDPAGGAAGELARLRRIVEDSLPGLLFGAVGRAPSKLREAMEYSLMAGGKRVRPVLLLSAGNAVGGVERDLVPFACAVEFIHTYSLVHDDLPAMDDDDFRRGKPSSHKAFGEGAAILAGDALLTEAFRVMAESEMASTAPDRAVRAIAEIARAAGAEGMVGGQQMDLSAASVNFPASEVEEIQLRKTAAILSSCARAGGILGGGTPEQVSALGNYGTRLGLLFQVTDDILDETGSFEEMGKGTAKDRGRGKWTYPVAYGMEAAVARAEELENEALAAVSRFDGEAEPLRELVRVVRRRRN